MTLVLDGAFDDQAGHYGRGDVCVADDRIEHQPVAAAGRDCLCLVVASSPIRLTGPLMRLLNPFLSR
jgi:putative transcriptional regulator